MLCPILLCAKSMNAHALMMLSYKVEVDVVQTMLATGIFSIVFPYLLNHRYSCVHQHVY